MNTIPLSLMYSRINFEMISRVCFVTFFFLFFRIILTKLCFFLYIYNK